MAVIAVDSGPTRRQQAVAAGGQFRMDPDSAPVTATMPALAEALPWLRHAQRILVFTGAGISTESGIPDFRGPNGVWKTTDPNRYTIQSYVSDPAVRVERWRARLEGRFSNAEPNPAHLAITRLQRAGLAPVVVTQNIDGLHQKAGTVNVIELHGTSTEAICLDCSRRMPIDAVLDRVREGDEDPHCELCGGLLKTATISFGQPLVAADMDRAIEEARPLRCLSRGRVDPVGLAGGGRARGGGPAGRQARDRQRGQHRPRRHGRPDPVRQSRHPDDRTGGRAPWPGGTQGRIQGPRR